MNDVTVRLNNVSKYYKLYNSPKDRLKEALHPLGRKYHREFYALQNITLEIGKGEIVGIVGKNGSGKSTLLKLISGVLKQNSGSMLVKGKISALLELGAGFNPEFTGLQNIYFYATVLGIGRIEIQSKLDEIIEFADIGEFINQPLKTYSSGMRSRLGFATAIHVEPDILILDEVLAVGDALFKRKCYAKMEEFFNNGKTVIYVSHSPSSINRICSRAVFLEAGRVLLDGDAKQVTSWYQKYMYASPENLIKVRSQIEELGRKSGDTKGSASGKETRRIEKDKGGISYRIPDFSPKSTLEYRNKPVRIYDAKIIDSNGNVVNVLRYGEVYTYKVKYKSELDEAVYSAAFGFDIKDQKGLRITAIESIHSFKNNFFLDKFLPGEEVSVEFEFTCLLGAGLYFTDNGISIFSSGEQEVLNRITDIMCFKVQESSDRIFGGICNCFTQVKIRKDSKLIAMQKSA